MKMEMEMEMAMECVEKSKPVHIQDLAMSSLNVMMSSS